MQGGSREEGLDVSVPVSTLQGAPLSAKAVGDTAPIITLEDNSERTDDTRVLAAIPVCSSFVVIVDSVPLPF